MMATGRLADCIATSITQHSYLHQLAGMQARHGWVRGTVVCAGKQPVRAYLLIAARAPKLKR